jgi:starch phosphorylase
MLQDIDALAALVNDPRRPVQFVFAGKSHPHDHPGKTLLQQIARLMHDPRFAGKLLFLEDYDISVGRRLVQGVDVWANNPRRPLEACGTSGQKVVLNGGLNCRFSTGGGPRRMTGRTASRSVMAKRTWTPRCTTSATATRCCTRCATR